MPPRPPRRIPRHDAQGCPVGDSEALGKAAMLETEPVGRITDVIFELASGDVVAYEFTDAAGAPHYLPASALERETSSELCFPPAARALIADDLPGLGDALAWDAAADAGEFTIVEDLTDRTK